MANKPTQFINWVSDGAASKISQPPPSQQLSGFTVGQAPPAVWFNWLLYVLDQWVQWLAGVTDSLASDSLMSIQNARLVGGGLWSWAASSGTLAWAGSFILALPSEPDSNNTVAAGSVTLTAGQVAYVNANLAFSATATATSGSTVLTAVSATAGLVVGQTVVGANVPGGTTIAAIGTGTVTLSAAATGSGTAPYSFYGSGAVTVQVASEATFSPAYNTVIIARCVGSVVYLGVGTGQMLLHDHESKNLLENGYTGIVSATAGVNLSAGQVVYVSPGAADGGNTAGSVYLCDTSQANGAIRSNFVGIVMSTVSAGATAQVVSDGVFQAFGLTPGAVYYADPTTPGGITPTKPTTVGQYIAPIGTAISTTWLDINPSQGAAVSQVVGAYNDNSYAVRSEADFNNAITACATAGGGEIIIVDPVTITTTKTIPSGTAITGRAGATPITCTAGATVTLGDEVVVNRLWLTTAQTGAVSLMVAAGNYGVLRDCRMAVPSTSAATCLTVTGTSNRIKDCVFAGVAAGSTGTGINYASGSSNYEYDSVYLA